MRSPTSHRSPITGHVLLIGFSGLLATSVCTTCADATPVLPQYRLDAVITPGAPQVEGTLEVTFTNHSAQTLREAVFFLFPNRFAEADPRINVFSRQYFLLAQD